MPTITSTHEGEMLFATSIGRHKILNDVPQTPDWDGKDRAPTPPEYFLASLSSCLAAFIVQYGNKANINTKDLQVNLHFEKGTDPAHLKNIRVEVHLPNANVGARAEAIRRVCTHCTVNATIERMVKLDIKILDSTNIPT